MHFFPNKIPILHKSFLFYEIIRKKLAQHLIALLQFRWVIGQNFRKNKYINST